LTISLALFEKLILQKDGHDTRVREMRIVAIIFMRKYLEKSPF
jgi:hypothetical protein